MSCFADPDHARAYAAARPIYPAALYTWLMTEVPGRDLAWDVGTGNGQVALDLAQHMAAVWATDTSAAQLAHAKPHPRVTYHQTDAGQSGLPDRSVDLVTVGQAIHWFDLEVFYPEVRRVAKPGALLAVWVYGVPRFVGPADALVQHLYNTVLEGYWDERRRLIDARLTTLHFPFPRLITPPELFLATDYTPATLVAYLDTWSAVRAYRAATGADPLAGLAQAFEETLGGAPALRGLAPLSILATRLLG